MKGIEGLFSSLPRHYSVCFATVRLLTIFSGMLAIMIGAAADAAPITGTVRETSGDIAVVTLEGQAAPAPGDTVDFFFLLPGTDQEISVATGQVISMEGGIAKVKIANATGEVKPNLLVRFKLAPKKPPAASPTPSLKPIPSPTKTTPPPPSLPTPTAPRPNAEVHTPATGSAERVAICDGARAYVLNRYAQGRRLPQSIVFKIEHLAVSGSYANLYGTAIYKDGRAVDQLPDIVYNLCLKNNSAAWHVVYDLSRGDVPEESELEKIRRALPADFPRSVLPSGWQQLLGK